ncbi:MAG: hypothetical protein AKCLJLPJ_02533 [Fimbriimonadales bacterium]|nr:hypothetical protein [Fimbriimonadales bacterium]
MSISSKDSEAVALASAIAKAGVAVPVLLAGAQGAGQNSVARELAKAYLCRSPVNGVGCGECSSCLSVERSNHADLFVVEPQGDGGFIRKAALVMTKDRRKDDPFPMSEFLRVGPLVGNAKVVIVRHMERLQSDAANTLLRFLEEHPAWCRFILTTSALGHILPTIRSRCLIVACGYRPAEESTAVARLTRGAPELADQFEEERCQTFAEDFVAWADQIPRAGRAEAVRLSDELSQWCDRFHEISAPPGTPLRTTRCKVLEMLGNLVSQSLGSDERSRRLLEGILEAHRAVTGNAQFESVTDLMFAESLR